MHNSIRKMLKFCLFAALMIGILNNVIAKELPLDFTVSGKVMDEKGESLPGVSVLLKDTKIGTTTDSEGVFSLYIRGQNGVLIFSVIGSVSQEVVINGPVTLTIKLLTDSKALDGVVVVGYGTQRKSDLTGSISSISESEIKKVPIASVGQALQGRAAGVQVTQTSQKPGGSVSVRIRGGNSLQGGNEPLYVIDGFPVYNESGPSINPNDIASIEILKDASATSIYGSRGANGWY